MLKRNGNWLIGAGLALVALGSALLLYNPEAGSPGIYTKAITGFAIPSAIGVLLAILGMVVRTGRRWALYAGLVLLLLTTVDCFRRSQKFRKASVSGEPHKSYAAVVVGLMAATSLVALVASARGVASLPPAGAGKPH